MKKYLVELIFFILQLLTFYLIPLFTSSSDTIGMVFMMIFITLLLSLFIALFSNKWIKYLYPFITAIIFFPSIYLYYNESAMIHTLWYFIISIIGLTIGLFIKKPFTKKNK